MERIKNWLWLLSIGSVSSVLAGCYGAPMHHHQYLDPTCQQTGTEGLRENAELPEMTADEAPIGGLATEQE